MGIMNNADRVMHVQLNRDEMRFAILGKDHELVHYHKQTTPMGAVSDGSIQNVDAICGAIKKVLRHQEFRTCRRIVFSLCTSQVITETVTTPNLPAKRLEKLLLANVDMYFPVDMKDYKLVWQTVGPKTNSDSNELQVQLWAVPVALVSQYYEVANACNLVVERIDYCGSSLAVAVGASFSQPVKPKERVKISLNTEITFGKKKDRKVEEPAAPVRKQVDTQLHIYVDNDLLGATFVQEGQVLLQRFISCGANPSYQFNELAMMVEFFRTMELGRGSAITGIVSGGLAEDAEIIEELGGILGLSLSVLSNGYAPESVLCVGAGMSALEFGIPALNALKTGRRTENSMWQYGLVLAAGVLMVGAVALLLTSRLAWTSEVNRLKSEQQTLLIQMKKTADYAERYDRYISEYDKYSSDWDTIFDNLRTYNDNLVLAMEELEATLPENTSVVDLQISADGLTVQFACSSKEEAAYLIMALREMEYMELAFISDLTGGGGGPATSYGPDDTEKPPVDGSYDDLTDEEIEIVAGLMMANMDQQQMMEVFLGLSASEMERLENVYGKHPTNNYTSLKLLRSAYATSNIFDQRSNALREMLTTNPFAVRSFVDLLQKDLGSENPILMWHIFVDLVLPENSDILEALMDGKLDSVEQAYDYMERLVDMITENDEKLTAAEDLMCTDKKMQKWYIYYLEMELGLQKTSSVAFLDMDRVIQDLLEGSFNTGDAILDKKLNALIPKTVWDTLKNMKDIWEKPDSKPDPDPKPDPNPDPDPDPNPQPKPNPGPDDYSRAELMAMIYQYMSTGKTNDSYINQLIENYLANGKTGDDRWDAWLKQYEHFLNKDEDGNGSETPEITKKPGDYMESELMAMLYQYLATNSTGDTYLDSLIDNYLASGSTGDEDWDAWIEPYKQYLPNLDSNYPGLSSKYPVYFTVVLKYKEALIEQELERKGLQDSDKIEKVEVLG